MYLSVYINVYFICMFKFNCTHTYLWVSLLTIFMYYIACKCVYLYIHIHSFFQYINGAIHYFTTFFFFFFNQEFVFDVSMEDFSTLTPHIVFHCLAFIYGINDLLLRFVRWASFTHYEIHSCKMSLWSIWAFINISISIIRTWYLGPKKTTHFKVWWEYVKMFSKTAMLYVKIAF